MFNSQLMAKSVVALLVCVVALFIAGCSGTGGGCGCDTGCGGDCCGNLDANCCSWDFYKPCDLIEGKVQSDCRCGSSPCGIVMEETSPCAR